MDSAEARRFSPTLELLPKQQQAVALLAAGDSYTDVARKLDVPRRTLFDWRQDPAFVADLSGQLAALRETTDAKLLSIASKAVDTLSTAMDSADGDAVKVSAARTVLDRIAKAEQRQAPEDVSEDAIPAGELAARVQSIVLRGLADLDDTEVLQRVRDAGGTA